jgi:hypothetical protein
VEIMTMPPRSNSDFIDDNAELEPADLAVEEEVPVEDALEQERETTDDAPGPPRERSRPMEASEADEFDQAYEVGYPDRDDY